MNLVILEVDDNFNSLNGSFHFRILHEILDEICTECPISKMKYFRDISERYPIGPNGTADNLKDCLKPLVILQPL